MDIIMGPENEKLAEKFLDSHEYWKDISSYVKKFTKKGKRLIELAYQVEPREYLIDYFRPSSSDSSYLLQFRKGPNKEEDKLSILGFEIINSNILITQIQGMKNQQNILKLLKWERMLVYMIKDWSCKNNVEGFRIQPAEKNLHWYLKSLDDEDKKDNGCRLKEHQDHLIMKYNVTAERSGFKYDENLGWWTLDPCS